MNRLISKDWLVAILLAVMAVCASYMVHAISQGDHNWRSFWCLLSLLLFCHCSYWIWLYTYRYRKTFIHQTETLDQLKRERQRYDAESDF